MLTIEPPRSSSRKWRIASRAHMNEPRRLTPSTRSKSALDSSSLGREIWIPALLTRTSHPPRPPAASPPHPAETLGGLAHHPHDVVLVRDVAADEHVADAHLLDLRRAGVDLLLGVVRLFGLAQVVDRDVRAVLGEAHRDGLADARAAAGDEHVLAAKSRKPGGLGRGADDLCHGGSPLRAGTPCSRTVGAFVTAAWPAAAPPDRARARPRRARQAVRRALL